MRRILGVVLIAMPLAALVAAGVLVPTEESQAIPAFARKYRMSCNTCHAPVPRLKAYGDEFAGSGFVLKDQEAPRYYVETGDKDLTLIRELPFALRLEGHVQHRTETGRKADFTFPYNLKLLSGGEITDNVAYYFYFFLSERGEVAGLEDAFIMFNNVAGSELDVYVGQFQVSDPLFKRELRLTYEDYQVYRYAPDTSQMDLAYDRGLMLTYGFESGTDVIVELLNGNGIGAADEDRHYDSDKYKSGAVRVSQQFNEKVRAGVIGYFGVEGTSAVKNEVRMAGVDATVSHGPFELNFQFMRRDDLNPMLADPDPPGRIGGTAGLAELIVLPDGDRSKIYAVALYNFVDRDDTEPLYHSVTGHVGYMLRTNIRVFAENTFFIEESENRAIVGLMTGF